MLTLIIIHLVHKYGLITRISKLVLQIIHRFISFNTITALLLPGMLTGTTIAQSQMHDYTYVIKKGGDSIGSLKTSQTKVGKETINKLDSKISLSLFFDFTIIESSKDVFHNNILSSGITFRTINGKNKLRNYVYKTPDGYMLKKKDPADTFLSGLISHCISSLYFDEPDDYNVVFSEAFQQNIKIKKVKPHKYLLEMPNGNQTNYIYNDGILIKVEAKVGLSTITMELENLLANK